jgi:methionyl-tRNA formyltransferase
VEALALIGMGQAVETPQDEALVTYAPKIDRTMARVDWRQDARQVARRIRAFDPRPGAFTTASSGEMKLFGARALTREGSEQPGQIVAIDATGLVVACGEGAVQIATVHPSGKRRITPLEWSRGRGIGVGECLS